MKRQWQHTRPALAALLGLFPAISLAGPPVSIQKVAATGDTVTTPGGTETITQISIPVISAAGEVSFSGALSGREAIFLRTPEGIIPYAVQQTQAPGLTEGVQFRPVSGVTFITHILRSGPALTFSAWLGGGDSGDDNNLSLWSGDAGGPVLVAREGSPAAGTAAGVTFAQGGGSLPSFRMAGNDSGAVLFTGRLQGPGTSANNSYGLWTWESAGGQSLAVRIGDAAPGLSENFRIIRSQYFNNNGTIAFVADVTGGTFDEDGIWMGTAGSFAPVVLVGETAPGTGGATFRGVGSELLLNDNDSVLFWGTVTGTGVTPGVNDIGLWLATGSGMTLVARRGDALPDVGDTEVRGPVLPVALASDDTCLFMGDVVRPGVDVRGGLWLASPSGTTLIVLAGQDVPSLPPGNTLGGASSATLNARGHVVFKSTCFINGSTSPSVFGWTEGAGVFPIAVSTLPLDVDGYGVRTVTHASLPGTSADEETVTSTGLTDDGEVVFFSEFRSEGPTVPVLRGVFVGTFLDFARAGGHCEGDWNVDGQLNSQDFFDFLGNFFTFDADFNGDGVTNSQDFFDYLVVFFAGC